MYFPHCRRFHALVVVLVVSWLDLAVALSGPPRPLRSLVHPTTRSLEILPRHYQSHTKRSPLDTRSTTLRHDDSFRLIVAAFDDHFYLHLRPNNYLVHPAARITYHSADGTTRTEPLLRESVKAYLGEVIDPQFSDVRLREDAAGGYDERPPTFEGAFAVDGVVHHIVHSIDGMVIWRDSDVMTPEEEQLARKGSYSESEPPTAPRTCAHDKMSYNTPEQNPIFQTAPTTPWYGLGVFGNTSLSRRDDVAGGGMSTNFANVIGDNSGCPKSQQVLYMGVAADCQYVSQYGNKDNATKQILNDWNLASSLYKSTFNVSLGIVELQVQDSSCPSATNSSVPWNVACNDNVTLNDRLSLFSQWRGSKGSDGVGLWHLMSGCPTGSEVGIAWLATLCQQSSSGDTGSVVSGTAVSTSGRTEWQVVAHEVGHNFGAICADGCSETDSCCPLNTNTCDATSRFIMSPVSQSSEQQFSACSLGNICSVMAGTSGSKVNNTCLIDASAATGIISLQMCGNGIVEDGEDCDPGTGVNSNCCDSSTCKFKNGAVCDPDSSACCTGQCTFALSTQVCRASKDSRCDTAETCTGNSSACPSDVVAPNGQSCGSGGLACASGQCTSVSLQCQSVGASMNLTTGCSNRNDQTCQISCQDPSNSNQCVLLSSLLIDGSPCGMCVVFFVGRAWYKQNLQIAIPVTIVAALIVLALLWAIYRAIRRCMTRKRVVRPSMTPTYSRLRHDRIAILVPPGREIYRSRANWVDENAYNGPRS
ncbi:zinc metalloprotease [Armillaria luteobubalina]|uniref:Disintegrin and metalloproteinase domain-containing protein B n=1 Tax=Armillaria luteobubalina TaxID=153913 RepID=A0AA39V0T8_9AGAR|nr:zinc metalloprotease [Armillaria luteobubalina]